MIEAKVMYLSADIVSDHSARRASEPDTRPVSALSSIT
jgi:hypothetical protein